MKKYLLLFLMDDGSPSVLFFDKINDARNYAFDNVILEYAIFEYREGCFKKC